METSIFSCSSIRRHRFKSYYVVWKPLWEAEKPIGHGKFKSYYVVWKLFFTKGHGEGHGEFKSYYVVWKHECHEEIWETLAMV